MKSLNIPKLSLKGAVNRLENAIITVSGPAIAISGIIAGIDLLTGGTMFKDVRWLSLTWAICLLLTLDFQVLMLGARARRVYSADKKSNGRKAGEIILIILIAAAISSVSVQMQSIIARTQDTVTYTDRQGQHIRNLTIDEATRSMGINPVALIWERSALVLVLIFMSGWFRDEEHQDSNAQTTTITAQPAQTVTPAQPEIDYAQIAQIVAPLIAQSMRSEVQSVAQSLKDDVQQDVQRIVQIAQSYVVEIKEIAQSAQPQIAQRSEVRNEQTAQDDEDTGETPIAQQTTMPVLHIVHSAQSDARSRVFAFLDAYHEEHGEDAAMPTNAVIMAGAPCAKNPASQYRKEYYEQRGGAQ